MGKTLNLYVPIDTTGMVQGSIIVVDAARLSIEAPGGQAWNSGWISSSRVLWPGPGRFGEPFEINSKFYSSVAGSPVEMRVSLALSEYREGAPQQITATTGTFNVTEDGICSVGKNGYWITDTVRCKAALNEPAFAAHMDPASTTCTLPDASWPSLQIRRNDANPRLDFGGGAGLVPVMPFEVNFGGAAGPRGENSLSIMCPGTKFSVATPALLSRYRIETKIQAVHLASYLPFNF
jgi:hypothetical protein